MKKEQLITILQATLFNFEGVSKQEFMKLNPDYDENLVDIGIKLLNFLQEKIK